MFDRNNMKMIAAAMSWPVIPVTAWGMWYLFGVTGGVLGCFLGCAIYFWTIYKAIPKDSLKDKDKK